MIKGSNFVVVNLPEDLVTEFGTERFQFICGIEIQQEFVDVMKVGRNFARQDDRFIAVDELARFNRLNTLDIFKARQLCSIADDVNHLADCVVKFGAIDMLVARVSRIITAGKIDGGYTKFRRN